MSVWRWGSSRRLPRCKTGRPFGHELLDALREAIPFDSAEYTEWPFHAEPSLHLCSPHDVWADQTAAVEAMSVACRTYPLRDVELASSSEPLRITDRVSPRAFRQTAFYALMMRPYGVEHELKLWLPAPPRHSYFFSLIRGPGSDFDDRDVAMLRLVRPHLARLRARWERAPRPPAQLTEREARRARVGGARADEPRGRGAGSSSRRAPFAPISSTSTRSSASGRAPAPSQRPSGSPRQTKSVN